MCCCTACWRTPTGEACPQRGMIERAQALVRIPSASVAGTWLRQSDPAHSRGSFPGGENGRPRLDPRTRTSVA